MPHTITPWPDGARNIRPRQAHRSVWQGVVTSAKRAPRGSAAAIRILRRAGDATANDPTPVSPAPIRADDATVGGTPRTVALLAWPHLMALRFGSLADAAAPDEPNQGAAPRSFHMKRSGAGGLSGPCRPRTAPRNAMGRPYVAGYRKGRRATPRDSRVPHLLMSTQEPIMPIRHFMYRHVSARMRATQSC